MTVMQTYNMFSIKLLFLLHVFYGSTFACHTKGTKNPLKQKVKTCHFVNVSKPLENNHWNRNSKSSTAQQLFSLTLQSLMLQSFHASKTT